jgi:hypothetical protein
MTKAQKAAAKIMAKKAALKASQEEEAAAEAVAVAAASGVDADAPASAAGGRAPKVAGASGIEDSTRHTNGVLASREASKDIKIIQFSMSAFGTLRSTCLSFLKHQQSNSGVFQKLIGT